MQATLKNQLIVLDPALGPEGGHHVALLECIQSAELAGEVSEPVEFYGSKKLSGSHGRRAGSENIRLVPFFSTEFYRFYTETPTLAAANHYIATLAKEYLLALERVITEHERSNGGVEFEKRGGRAQEGRLLILYPAMQWMHLMALHYALRKIASKTVGLKIEHRLCLMYNPGRDHTGELVNISEWLSYKLACKSLADYENVTLYASDYELADHFGHLRGGNEQIPLHPQYLVRGEKEVELRPRSGSQGKVIGLYFGDAKVEKGFTRLPGIIESLLPVIEGNDELVVQYVSQGNCPRILAVEKLIREISVREARLKIIPEYLSVEKMHKALASLDIFLFNYDVKHYRNKSSGFLWVLAGKPCKLVFAGESWLSREAGRLGMAASVCAPQELQRVLPRLLKEKRRVTHSVAVTADIHNEVVKLDYKDRLYRPFVSWLQSETGVNIS